MNEPRILSSRNTHPFTTTALEPRELGGWIGRLITGFIGACLSIWIVRGDAITGAAQKEYIRIGCQDPRKAA
jgi:hypothetical protein